jgi:nitrate reductase NapE component
MTTNSDPIDSNTNQNSIASDNQNVLNFVAIGFAILFFCILPVIAVGAFGFIVYRNYSTEIQAPNFTEVFEPSPTQNQIPESDLTGELLLPADEQTKLWIIASTGILTIENRDSFTEFKSNIPLEIQKNLLDEWWGITDEESAIGTMEWLLYEGQRSEIEYVKDLLSKEEVDYNKEYLYPNGERISEFNISLTNNSLMDKDMSAWDLVRVIQIARWSLNAGYISEDTALRFSYYSAINLQRKYDSWEEMGNIYILGRQYWSEKTANTSSSLNVLTNPQNGVWAKLDWNTELKGIAE